MNEVKMGKDLRTKGNDDDDGLLLEGIFIFAL
jgi:hypothetical protein